MKLLELAGVLAIDVEDEYLDNEKWLFHDELIFEICGPLIRLTNPWGTCEVEFSHFSVVEYLTKRQPNDENHEFFVDQLAGHVEIARCCLTYLSFPGLIQKCEEIGHDGWIGMSSVLTIINGEVVACPGFLEWEFDLIIYASQFWYQHAQEVEHNPSVHRQIYDFFCSPYYHDVFEGWARVWRNTRNTPGAYYHPLHWTPHEDGLAYAAILGLPETLGDILKQKRIIHRRRLHAMVAAAYDQTARSLERLIEEGMDIDK